MSKAESTNHPDSVQEETISSPDPQSSAGLQLLNLAVEHHNAGRLGDAEKLYRQILETEPGNFDALHLLGLISFQNGRNDEAVGYFNQALAILPDYAEAHFNLANALKNLNRLDQALKGYEKAVALKPDFAEAHNNMGNALYSLGKQKQAARAYQMALAVEPDNAQAHYNLGNALKEMGRLDDALESYRQAITLNPAFAEAHHNLGHALRETGRLEEAVESCRTALGIRSGFAEAHNTLGNALRDLGRLDDASTSYREALALQPDYVDAHINLGTICKDTGDLDQAATHYRAALDADPNSVQALSNLILANTYRVDLAPDEYLAEPRRYGAIVAKGITPVGFRKNDRKADRPLRIGLVSGDFRVHPVTDFLKDVLAEIDGQKLELFAYANATREDDLTTRLKEIIPHWHNAVGISDKVLASRIVEDEIDILVDLSGHTANTRLPLFAWKPAPVQVTWLGYNGTSGVEAMDYILCDKTALPVSAEPYFTEKPWRLPDIWSCYSPPDLDMKVNEPPVLANGYITFGSFNNLSKVSDETVACWSRILEAMPDSCLLLKAKQLEDSTVREKLCSRFEAQGTDRQRIDFRGFSSKEEYLQTYREIDIALDPFPYCGVTTSVEALWMGVPVLTLMGDHFVSRTGGSLLSSLGMSEWIAGSPADYVEKSKTLASDLAGLSTLRANLRDQLLASPICDAPWFARNLEKAFREMWASYLEE